MLRSVLVCALTKVNRAAEKMKLWMCAQLPRTLFELAWWTLLIALLK